MLSDASGAIVESYAYLVFGQPYVMTDAGADGNWLTADTTTYSTSAVGNPYMFTGRRWDDAAQLYYYRFRDYAPLEGVAGKALPGTDTPGLEDITGD